MSVRSRSILPLVLALIPGVATAAVAPPALIAPALDGGVPNGVREDLFVSNDLRWVAFTSTATDLDAGDTDPLRDVYLTDSTTGVSTRISRDPVSGATSTVGCEARAISGDGRTVAMVCSLKGLVPGIHPSTDPWGVYLYERDGDGDGTLDEPGDIRFVRVEWDGAGSPASPLVNERLSLSADGRRLTYRDSSQPLNDGGCGLYRVWLVDRDADADGVYDEAGGISGACPIPAESTDALISGDGNVIAFETGAALLPSDGAFGRHPNRDVYVKDLRTGAIEIASVGPAGQLGTASSWLMDISHDGTRVLFDSDSRDMFPDWTNLTRTAYLRDLSGSSTEHIAYNIDSYSGTGPGVAGSGLDLSPDGTRALVWTDRYWGMVVHDLQIVRIGQRGMPIRFRHVGTVGAIDATADRAVFMSAASDLVADDTNGTEDLFLIEDEPDLEISVTGSGYGSTIHHPGGIAIFNVGFTNRGTTTSAAGVMRVPAIANGQIAGVPFGCTKTPTTVECPVPKLYPNEGRGYRVDVLVTEVGTQSLSAELLVPGDVDPANDSGSASVSVVPGADLDIFVTVSPSWIIQPGGSVAMTFLVENRGTIHTATNTVMTVDFDPDISILAGSIVTSAGASCVLGGTLYTCGFGNLAPGATAFIRIGATGTTLGNHSVVARVASDVSDPATGNNILASQLGVIAPPPPPPPPPDGDEGGGGGGGGGSSDLLYLLSVAIACAARRRPLVDRRS